MVPVSGFSRKIAWSLVATPFVCQYGVRVWQDEAEDLASTLAGPRNYSGSGLPVVSGTNQGTNRPKT